MIADSHGAATALGAGNVRQREGPWEGKADQLAGTSRSRRSSSSRAGPSLASTAARSAATSTTRRRWVTVTSTNARPAGGSGVSGSASWRTTQPTCCSASSGGVSLTCERYRHPRAAERLQHPATVALADFCDSGYCA